MLQALPSDTVSNVLKNIPFFKFFIQYLVLTLELNYIQIHVA